MSPDTESAVDVAYTRIRQLIVNGTYKAGSRLKEERLAEAVVASRTPVRHALARLHSEGLIVMHKNRGAFVAEFSTDDAREVFELRSRLEPYAARLAATRCDNQTLDELDELASTMEALDLDHPHAVESMARLNNQFHDMIAVSSGSTRTYAMFKGLISATLVLRTFAGYDQAAWQRSLAHHREVIEALRARDPDWAESVMHTHIVAGRSRYLGPQNDR